MESLKLLPPDSSPGSNVIQLSRFRNGSKSGTSRTVVLSPPPLHSSQAGQEAPQCRSSCFWHSRCSERRRRKNGRANSVRTSFQPHALSMFSTNDMTKKLKRISKRTLNVKNHRYRRNSQLRLQEVKRISGNLDERSRSSCTVWKACHKTWTQPGVVWSVCPHMFSHWGTCLR